MKGELLQGFPYSGDEGSRPQQLKIYLFAPLGKILLVESPQTNFYPPLPKVNFPD